MIRARSLIRLNKNQLHQLEYFIEYLTESNELALKRKKNDYLIFPCKFITLIISAVCV